jgi:hypothetical protein
MTGTDAPAHASPRPQAWTVPASALLTCIVSWLLLDQWLLWQFLGLPFWLGLIALPPAAILLWRLSTTSALQAHIPVARLLLCLASAALLLALGGEGRFFYANIDWQVRDAVLRDMALHPWPFVYVEGGAAQLLRAPIGMFLLPSLVFKAGGAVAGDLALWVQNSLLIGSLLAIGSTLFDTARARMIALVTILLFSGLDIVGTLIFHGYWRDHLEFWFATMQYSSHITQAFWVPQHGFAGWLAALLFLLWHRGRMTLWPLFAILPLTALWSPLALIGAMPFALWAGLSTLAARKLTLDAIGWPAVSVLLALPGLIYLAAAPDGVGIRPYPLQMLYWLIFVTLELLVYALPLLFVLRRQAGRGAPLLIATIWLLVAPFIQIGWSLDFMMRTSIPSLAVLAVLVAEAIATGPSLRLRLWLALMLLIASATGLNEVARAFAQPPSPRGQCSFFGAWDVSFGAYPKGSYLAPLDQLPAAIRPAAPARVNVEDPSLCWQGRWARPNGV